MMQTNLVISLLSTIVEKHPLVDSKETTGLPEKFLRDDTVQEDSDEASAVENV